MGQRSIRDDERGNGVVDTTTGTHATDRRDKDEGSGGVRTRTEVGATERDEVERGVGAHGGESGR